MIYRNVIKCFYTQFKHLGEYFSQFTLVYLTMKKKKRSMKGDSDSAKNDLQIAEQMYLCRWKISLLLFLSCS